MNSVNKRQTSLSSERQKQWLDVKLTDTSSHYERYLNTANLFACQKPAGELCNEDEMQFQTVLQVEELWMKLLCHTLVDVESAISNRAIVKALHHFKRGQELVRLMRTQLDLLHTMAPKHYIEIRAGLNWSNGQDSPAYRQLLKRLNPLWQAYVCYLAGLGCEISDVYAVPDQYPGAHAMAESFVEFDLGLTAFRHTYTQLLDYGIDTDLVARNDASLATLDLRGFPLLWAVRRRFIRHGSSIGNDTEEIAHDVSELEPEVALAASR